MGLIGSACELASNFNHLGAWHPGDSFLPGWCTWHIFIETAGDMITTESTVETILRQ